MPACPLMTFNATLSGIVVTDAPVSFTIRTGVRPIMTSILWFRPSGGRGFRWMFAISAIRAKPLPCDPVLPSTPPAATKTDSPMPSSTSGASSTVNAWPVATPFCWTSRAAAPPDRCPPRCRDTWCCTRASSDANRRSHSLHVNCRPGIAEGPWPWTAAGGAVAEGAWANRHAAPREQEPVSRKAKQMPWPLPPCCLPPLPFTAVAVATACSSEAATAPWSRATWSTPPQMVHCLPDAAPPRLSAAVAGQAAPRWPRPPHRRQRRAPPAPSAPSPRDPPAPPSPRPPPTGLPWPAPVWPAAGRPPPNRPFTSPPLPPKGRPPGADIRGKPPPPTT